jgi:hypothetical protein
MKESGKTFPKSIHVSKSVVNFEEIPTILENKSLKVVILEIDVFWKNCIFDKLI